jgi:ACS family glucarate transporter-like MFS transporter
MRERSKPKAWLVVTLLAGFSLMSYVLRMNISIASKFMMPEFGLSQIQMGQVFSSFMLGYALFQIPTGALGDLWGPRLVLALAGISWGLTTFLTALVPGTLVSSATAVLIALMVIRFCLGAGEAATYPVGMRAIVNWIEPSQRALKNAIVIAGATLGSAATPPLISWLMVTYGWRSSFYVTGAAVFVVSLIWWIKGADSPDQSVRQASAVAGDPSAQTPADTPSGKLGSQKEVFRKKQLWLLSVGYLFDSYVLFIFVFWLYTYLTDVRHFSLLKGGFFTSLPFIVASGMTPLGGYICDRLCRRFGPRRGRLIQPVISLLLAGACLFLGAKVANPYIAIAVLSLSVGFIEGTEGAYWLTATDIGHGYAGAAGGMMNMFGNFGGVISTALVPVLVQHFGWLTALGSGTLAAIIAASLWFWVRVGPERSEQAIVHEVLAA